jgi:maltokinase
MVQDVRGYASGGLDAESVLTPARTLGTLVADMHAALASTGVEHATSDLARAWHARALADLARAVHDVDGDEGARLRALAEQVSVALDALAGAAGTPLIDVHGDLHVGQVLRHGSPAAYAITDFDGSPVLAPANRSDRQPAALDVAGMMASLDHVGRVVVHRTAGVDVAAVTHWIEEAERGFLDSYRTALDAHGLRHLLDETLLHPLRLAQECREYLYALDHLPHWRYVPDAALPALLQPTTQTAPQE